MTIDAGPSTTAVVLEGFSYDPLDFEALRDPFPTYRILRDQHPVYHNPSRGIWALSRFDDVQAASRDWKRFSNTPSVDLDEMPARFGPGSFIDLDPPRHDELRDVVRRLFAPKAILALEEQIHANVDDLIAEFIEKDEVDLATAFAWQVPVAVISSILGFPSADRPRLLKLSLALTERTSGSPAIPEQALAAADDLFYYFDGLLSDRSQSPRTDVLSQLAEAHKTGRVSRREVTGVCYLLFAAGIETTASLLSNALHMLALRPDHADHLRHNPNVLPRAVEEFLRVESPVQHLARTTTTEVEVGGTIIPAGSRVVLIHGAANRDPRRFPSPDEVDFDREVRRTMTFGEGIHFCLGAPLARPEARIALGRFLARIDDFGLVGRPERTPSSISFGYWRLPAKIGHRT